VDHETHLGQDAAEQVNAAMAKWCQGDVAEFDRFVWLAANSEVSGSASGSMVKETPQRPFVVVSQTCDIRRDSWAEGGKGRPYVQLSPLVRLSGEELRLAQGDFLARYGHVPGAGPDAFADLDRCITIEKAVLARSVHLTGCADELSRRRFSRSAARHRGRFAFPDGVDTSIGRLRDYLRKRRNQETPQGLAVRAIQEIRARANPSFDAKTGFQMYLVFLIDPTILPPSTDDAESCTDEFEAWRANERPLEGLCAALSLFGEPADRFELWQLIADEWAAKCEPTFPVTQVHAEASSTMEYPISRARAEPSLDLEHMSSEETRMTEDEVYDAEP
jgi:hypothetical protein